MNVYGFARNSPANRIDILGLLELKVIVGAHLVNSDNFRADGRSGSSTPPPNVLDQLDFRFNQAKQQYQAETGEECNVSLSLSV